MKKLIAIFAVIGAIIASPAYAEDGAISFSQEEETVTVTGKTAHSLRSENITVIITRKGVNIAEESFETSESKDKLELVANAATDENGEWSVIWQPFEVGYYDVKATVNSTGEAFESEYYYVEESRKRRIENALLSGSLSELESVFSDRITLYVLERPETEVKKIQNTSKVGRALYYIRQDLTTASDIYNYIDLAMEMAVFNETAGGFAVITEKMKQYDDIEKLSFYNDISVSNVKNQVAVYAAKGILEAGLKGYSDLFTEAIVLAGVEKSSNYSYLGSYLDLLEYSKYDNAGELKEAIQLALIGKSYTIETLKAAIDAVVDAPQGGNNDNNGDDDGGYTGGGGGGGYSTGMSNVESNAPVVNTSFTDVSSSHWAFAAISNLRDRKIIDGFEDNSYRPDNSLTRAEAVKLLCRAFKIDETSGESVFSDVKEADWYAPCINAAYKAGFVNGDGTAFNPNNNITRQDLCVMIYRFAQRNLNGDSADYADAQEISEYAKQAVVALSSSGIINGFEDKTFRPLATATRAQMAQMLYKYLLMSAM